MIEFEIIQHKNVNNKQLDDIIIVKSSAWPYAYKKQLQWIDTNIKDMDFHLLLFEDALPIAYLNLIAINLVINDRKVDGFGIGNVSTYSKGKGWGKELMAFANNFIINRNKIGFLFCKRELISFYSKNGWELISKNKLKLNFKNDMIETMIFNYSKKIEEILFNGNPF